MSTEAREKEKLDIGMIAVDAIFTPIRNVGVRVENVRVGQMTTFNKIVLVIETDGSITAEQAVHEASSILVEQFQFLTGHQEQSSPESLEENNAQAEEVVSNEYRDGSSKEVDERSEGEDGSEEEKKEPKKRGRPRKGLL